MRFGLELCALAAIGSWGLQAGGGAVARIGLGIGAPVGWAVEGAVLGLAVAGLGGTGHPRPAWALEVARVVNRALLAVTERADGAPRG